MATFAYITVPLPVISDVIPELDDIGGVSDLGAELIGSPDAAAAREVLDVPSRAELSSAGVIRFSAAVAMAGVTSTDRAYIDRQLRGARMRVSSAPAGAALTVVLQHFTGTSWIDVTTLTIADGSVVEVSDEFVLDQVVGNLLRLNVTSVGSTAAATGVVVDVLVA